MDDERKDSSHSVEADKSKRVYWLDHARGFVMIFLVVTMFLPTIIRTGNDMARFFLEHPENSTTTEVMNFYDLGAPVFILIMGLLMPVSFKKRKERAGTSQAIKHIIIRYGFILLLGFLVFIIDGGQFIHMDNGAPKVVAGLVVIRWDVLPTLGLVGIVALPFLFLKPKVRMIAASAMLLFYQIMLLFGGWRDYAIASIHGGILGTIFGFSALMVYATCCGEYLFPNENYTKDYKYKIYGLVAAAIFIGSILLSFVPEWYANKRQVTLTYILISTSSAMLLSFIFILIDRKLKKPIMGWDSYGKNFFITYLFAVILEFVIVDLVGIEIDVIISISIIALITIFVIYLDKKDIIIKL